MTDHARAFAAAGIVLVFTGCAGVHPVEQQTGSQAPTNSEPAPRAQSLPRKAVEPESRINRTPVAVQDPRATWAPPVHDDQLFTFLRAEQLEYRARDHGPDVARWEAQGWYGGDYQKLWIKTEGEKTVEGPDAGELEVQALYSRVIAPFWDFQAGARYDAGWGPGPDSGRWFGVVGVQGFSPYEFEVEATLFVSEDGDVSARLTATTDVLFTQRLILQPRFETEISAQDVPKFQVGEGLNYVDLGLRLRYEVKREFAPYVGINWIRNLGETEGLVRRGGGEVSDLAFVLGVSSWF
jgi:copper resistance protein B